jgi:hypothetical protein
MDRVQRKKDARDCPQASTSDFFSSLVNQRASWDGPPLLAATASSTLDAYIWQEQWCYASVGEQARLRSAMALCSSTYGWQWVPDTR